MNCVLEETNYYQNNASRLNENYYFVRKYDDEFKRNAVRLVFDGQSVRSVSQELCVNESQIHKWKRAALANGDGVQSGTELTKTAALKNGFASWKWRMKF